MAMLRPKSTLQEVDDTEEYLNSKGFEKMDIGSCKKYLKMVEEHGLRRPMPVYAAAGLVIENEKKAKISKQEKYAVVEQLALSALDLNDTPTARRVVEQLYLVFPKSVRVGKIEGMCLESEGKWEEALKKYDELLEKSPAEQRVMKRKVAVYKSQGRTTEAIDELTKYLDTFMGDFAAWEELALLYAECRMYQQAVFCWEEVIVAQPQMHYHHRRIAEVYYTMGGEDHLRAARKYYAAAADMSNATDARALYGLTLVNARLAKFEQKKLAGGRGGASTNADDDSVGPDLSAVAGQFLCKLYAVANAGLLPVVERVLKK
mmetsp:Transcript_20469/g.33184  ORF Transcript_20469/g.33184 Transcript_20469/m.33184 type:complete len:318 (-) Transcript_20469:80-1033(-)